MDKGTVWTVIIGAIYIATIMMLVRPNSKGPAIVHNVSGALADLIKGATGASK